MPKFWKGLKLHPNTVDVRGINRDLLIEILECAAVGERRPGIDPNPDRTDLIAQLHEELNRDDE